MICTFGGLKNKKMISLIIPQTSDNPDYTKALLDNIEELYPNRKDIEVIVETNDKVSLGINYNNAVKRATGNKIILLHNDMILSPGFIETMDKHISKGKVTTYTRVEPPIFPDLMPGKLILDCGSTLEEFNKDKWNEFSLPENIINGGTQLFFGCMREDYIGIDGYTFYRFREDDDLHLRYKILGFQHIVSSAHVYHFVSKTVRKDNSYKQIEAESHRAFDKKWKDILYIN
eukprot:SAG31_NODE_986_length_10547_cov_5.126627_15_plen_231_part_00